jgi:hypothetical protein
LSLSLSLSLSRCMSHTLSLFRSLTLSLSLSSLSSLSLSLSLSRSLRSLHLGLPACLALAWLIAPRSAGFYFGKQQIDERETEHAERQTENSAKSIAVRTCAHRCGLQQYRQQKLHSAQASAEGHHDRQQQQLVTISRAAFSGVATKQRTNCRSCCTVGQRIDVATA